MGARSFIVRGKGERESFPRGIDRSAPGKVRSTVIPDHPPAPCDRQRVEKAMNCSHTVHPCNPSRRGDSSRKVAFVGNDGTPARIPPSRKIV
jgi:hypothetical protein